MLLHSTYIIVNFHNQQLFWWCTKTVDVKVRVFTNLREILNKREENLTFPNAERVTVGSILKKLSQKYGKTFTAYVYDGKTGQPKSFLQFLVNGTSVSTLNGLETVLNDGDVLAILPPVGGG
jgi:molybdopterin synthase sulfur carrier subunit